MISGYAAGALGALLIGKGTLGRGVGALGACAGSAAGLALGMSAIVSGQSFTLAHSRVPAADRFDENSILAQQAIMSRS